MPAPANDYRIFAGAFPQGELADRIQAVRQRLDLKTARITPPHVTLAGTYWRSGPATETNEAEAIARLQAVHDHLHPFALVLGGIFTFPPADSPVIYLGVVLTPEIQAVRQVLLRALGADKHRQFSPHLTLAMRLHGEAARRALDELQRSEWNTGRWQAPITELRLMQRGPADPAWRTIARLPCQ